MDGGNGDMMRREVGKMDGMKIDMKSRWYKNCKRNRKKEAKICDECPFRCEIEKQERDEKNGNWEFFGL